MLKVGGLSLCALLAMAISACGSAEEPAPEPHLREASEKIVDFIQGMDELGPGYGFVLVTADQVITNHVQGQRNAATGAPLTRDTPMYIASQTKSYLGLLASILHEEGILSLDDALSEYWPTTQALPPTVDLEQLTLRDLLTHQFPIRAPLVNIIEANVTRIRPEDFPRLIRDHGKERDPGFRYDNIGYNLYGAILEQETGRPWQDWLKEKVFDPLQLPHTSARTSDFDPGELGWQHIWLGPKDGYHAVPPKTDDAMQSAGGIVTSTTDLARFLQTYLRQAGPDGSAITRDIIERHTVGLVASGYDDQPYLAELGCSHYTLGWNICDYDGNTVYAHGGSYVGMRSTMLFSHDLGIGAAVFSNSSNQTGWINGHILNLLLQYVSGEPDADANAVRYHNEFSNFVAEEILLEIEVETARQNDEAWGGWSWSPTAQELQQYMGVWTTGEVYLDLNVEADENGNLVVKWYDYEMPLKPAREDVFAGRQHPFESFETFKFQRDERGLVQSLDWGGDIYVRP